MSCKKNFIALPSLCSNEMDIETIEVFQNNNFGGTHQKNVLF